MQTDTMSRFDGGYLRLIFLERVLTFIVRRIKKLYSRPASSRRPRKHDSTGNGWKFANRNTQIMQNNN